MLDEAVIVDKKSSHQCSSSSMINNIQESLARKDSRPRIIFRSDEKLEKPPPQCFHSKVEGHEEYRDHEKTKGTTNDEYPKTNFKCERERYIPEDRDNFRQYQPRSYCNLIRKDQSRVDTSKLFDTFNTSVQNASIECSRRPIRCPRVDCAINVAFSSLTHHFLFDHPEVPILSVDPGARKTLSFTFSTLPCESSRCLALLLVSGKLSNSAARLFNGNQVHPKYRNRLPLPILAARLHCTSRCSTKPCIARHEQIQSDGEGKNCEGDVIIVWVAGLDIGNSTEILRCSIQAVDDAGNNEFRSMTYTGPVNSLRTAQCPREVFLSGDCVTLHEGFVNNISNECSSLNINVTVH